MSWSLADGFDRTCSSLFTSREILHRVLISFFNLRGVVTRSNVTKMAGDT
jgi:hypothetical protein